MLRGLLNFVARRLKGPQYQLAPDIPLDALLGLGWRRGVAMARGLLRTRRPVFLGQGVRLVNKRFLKLGKAVTLQDGVFIDAFSRQGVCLGDRVNIGPHVRIQATGVMTQIGTGLEIGADSGIGAFSFIGCGGGVKLGRNVIMGQYVSFHSENHNYGDLSRPIRTQGVTRAGIEIGDDCWIGAKVTFIDGAKVGSGVVVAAGSVVRGQIPSNVVVGGVPARVLRQRGGVEAGEGTA